MDIRKSDPKHRHCYVSAHVHGTPTHGYVGKKVCNAWAGSALMREPALVARILEAVVAAVEVPVTLKIRTGWAAGQRNAVEIARIAESARIAALAVHARTPAQRCKGQADYPQPRQAK